MRLSKQLSFSNMKKPKDYSQRKTSSLLEDGIFMFFKDPGVPFYLPIGRRILRNVEDVFLEESSKLDISPIEIPAIMKDGILEEGEEISDTFDEGIVRLSNKNLGGYHLLTTPETMILDLARGSLHSHRQLPIRFVYNTDIVRGIRKPKGILKGRQFKTFMGNSLDRDVGSLGQSLQIFEELSDNIFRRLGVETYKRRGIGGIDVEHFYFGEEGDNIRMPEVDPERRVKALSLAMAYHYNPEKMLKARFRNESNQNSRALYCTFGLGTQRAIYAMFDSHRDDRGFKLPSELAPYGFDIIPVSQWDSEEAEELYSLFGGEVLLDDRRGVSFGERTSFSDYIGVPWKIIIGNGEYTLKDRDESCERRFFEKDKLFKEIGIQ
jgi:prolyl-tRNA synthetase